MNKLQIINESISEIRDILNADCTSVTELPDLVRSLVNDPSKSGYTTAFVFSSELQPNTPTGGSLDTNTGLVVGLEEGWSQGVEEKITTFKSRSISKPSSTNWMSFAIFGPSGERVTEWSIPVNLKGSKGEQGIPGQIGAQGPEGPKGEKGDSANSYRTVSVYTTTETIDTPAKPIGGKWNLETNEVTPPTTEVGVKWFLNADEPSKNNYLWMSQATFGETGDLIGDWCIPFRLTGEAGKNGADGRVTEFIYRLVPDFETYKKLKPWTDKLYSPEYEDDKVPLPNDDLNLSTKWTDQPSGITESMQIEVCCTRTRKGVEQPWSEWSSCIIWSKWGEDGMDGDGVEYIYLVTPDTTNEGEPIDSHYVLNYFTPDRKAALNDEYYQQDEFCFNGAWGYTGYDWSDEPKDVGPGKPLEWVMIRKKKKNGKGDVIWGEFSDPAIWGRFAEDGLPYLTSFVFTRSIDFPGQPTGGSYENPKPDQSIWSDSVPVISETMKGPVWMSTRVFYAGDVNAFDKDWTLPKIIADTHDFQVEYSKGNENGLVPNLDPFTGDEDAWRAKQKVDYGIEWGDDAQITDPTWMITSSCDNGVWKPWVLTRIKGEKGAAGQNGTSVEVRGKFPTLAAIKEEWREYAEDGTDFYGTTILHNGDAYFVEENGMLYIYNGGFYPGEETTFEVYWAEVQLTGEKGDSFYFYVAYCETLNEGATLYFDVPKKYIGTIISDKPLEQDYLNKWSSYKNWTKWLGEDGWGQEQIFLLTSKNASYDPAIAGKKPLLPVNEEGQGNVKEYLPLHGLGDLAKGADDQPDRWSDSPLTVSEDYPYCWVVSRSVPDFGAWKGDGSYASLYSRYSYDGKDGNSTISVNLTNDLAVIPMEGDVIDPEFIASHVVTTSLQVFIGDDPIPSDRTTVSIEGGYATWDESTDIITLNFDKLPANVNEIPIIVTVDGGSNHTITWKLFKTDTAYEISPDVHVIKRYVEGDKTGQLETKSFDVKVEKWDGEKWIASNKAVFVEITTKEGKQWYSNQSNVVTETSGGTATVNIGEIHDIKAITVYLTNDDKDNGTRISFEDIAIVADGITGPQGPQGLAGLDANASFKSTVFRRGEGPFNAPEGGDYNSPKPTTDGWFESIPDGTAILWASTRIFSSDGKYPQENKWSAPAKMTDTADFDVEFSSTINPGNPTSNPENWSNNSDTSTIWMAIRKAKNGVWGEWQVSKIKGEDGNDGHSIVMHETEPTNPEMGDGYVNGNGELLIWDGDSWVNCGKIKGEDGKAPIIGDNNNWQFWDGEKYVDSGHSAIGDDGHSPYIKDGIWWEWNGSEYVSTGIRAKGIDGTDGINGKDGVSIVWKGDYVSHPSNPQNGWAYKNTTDKKSYIYQDNAWYQMTIDGINGQDGKDGINGQNGINGKDGIDGKDGKDGIDGLSIVWKGESATAPSNPQTNWCYKDTDNGKVYIYNGSAWELMVLDGSDGANGTNGEDGLSVFITYHDNAITSIPNNPTGNGTTNGWHTNATSAANWMSQKVAATAFEGNWGAPIQICGANGQDGTNNFIHVKYASEVTTNSEGYGITGKFTESDGEEPGKYMGIYVDDVEDDVLDITKYKWTKAEGEDGFGYEYIYQRNNNPVAPIVPTDITADDVAPTGWTDGPSGVNSTEMYEWVCWRKKTGGEWSKWIGSAENKGVAALWAKFGEKGETGENGKDAVISQAMLDQAAANIAQGFYTKEQIDTLETSLNNAISSGDAKAIADAAAALNTANEINKELTSLQSKFNDDGTIKDSVLREEDIYNLSKAALGTDISENGVFAQQIVGLVGTYGKINVDNLVGDTISGKTVQSADANGNLGEAWKLENTGAGHIANGQISWNADGSEVNLGSNVKISWSDNISDSDKAAIKTYSQDGTVSNDIFNEEVGSLQTRMESVENDLPNYALLSELSNEVKKEVNGLGFVTDEQLNEYLKSSDLNGSIELYLLNSKSEVADIIGDSVLAKLDKEALSTELGKDYIKTGTTFTNTLFSGDIYGKSIKNDSSGSIWSIKEDGSASFCSGKIKFNKNGSGNLGAGLSWNQDGTTTLSNQLIFKSGYLTSGDYQNQISWDDEGGSIDLDLKQQWVLDTSIKYGTLYLNESQCQYNNITNINILNIGNYVSRIDNGDIPFVLGSETGMLILPGHSLFTGMTFDGNCYCPSNYYITKCSGGRDGNVNYITPWDNPGYAMSVRNYNGTQDVVDNTTSSIGTTLLDITVSCPKIVIAYDTDSVKVQKTSSGGSNQRLFFTLNNTVATQRQYYINIYFYFNELCVGRYCVSGNAEIYND